MKIVLLDASTLGDLEVINELKRFGDFVSYQTTTCHQTVERIIDAEIIITNKVVIDAQVMEQCKSLKLICVAATGMNNIDLEFAKKNGIEVKNVSGYSTESVAQQTFSMLLSLTNHVNYYSNYVQSGNYSQSSIFTLVDKPIFELNNKTLGIIGMGTIGRRVAKIAQAFGMKVIYYSASGVERKEEFHKVDFDTLLAQSDVLTIHAPLTDKTKNIIDYKAISKMKTTAILLNAGRGGIVNENDLVNALNENLIKAAGLDVFEKEPLSIDSHLLKINNPEKLLMFPHIAWASVEARNTLVKVIIKNIESFLTI